MLINNCIKKFQEEIFRVIMIYKLISPITNKMKVKKKSNLIKIMNPILINLKVI